MGIEVEAQWVRQGSAITDHDWRRMTCRDRRLYIIGVGGHVRRCPGVQVPLRGLRIGQ